MITYHDNLEQGSDEWLAARFGLLTASEMKLIITPTLKIADNDKTRLHLYELCAQRVSKYVEPSYISEDMLRGTGDEFYARDIYHQKIAPVKEVGFVTNDKWGFTIGYSPDGLVGEDGLIEIKSRKQKYQVRTIVNDGIDVEFLLQLQTGLMVTERKWIDFLQYSGGLPLYVKRIYPDPLFQTAIFDAATEFESKAKDIIESYTTKSSQYIMTERIIIETEINL